MVSFNPSQPAPRFGIKFSGDKKDQDSPHETRSYTYTDPQTGTLVDEDSPTPPWLNKGPEDESPTTPPPSYLKWLKEQEG